MPFLLKKEVIVYLIDYKYEGNNVYSNVIFDFRTEADVRFFYEEMDFQNAEIDNTLMSISRFQSPKRLRRGCYYNFRVSELKRIEPQREWLQDSALLAYNFVVRSRAWLEPIMLFAEHGPLEPSDTYPLATGFHGSAMPVALTDGKLRVNNVGQGNHNEILNNGSVSLVYDMGASLHSSRAYVENLIKDRIGEYEKSHPVLIISHWDLDHVLQLKFLTDQQLACFSHVYCPQKIKSFTARKIFDKLNDNPNISVHVLSNRARTGIDYPLMMLAGKSNGFSLYAGEDNRNINYCGLVLFAHGTVGNALLTGDCILAQASDVLSNESKALTGNNSNHKLVVPHHGGGYSYKTEKYTRYDVPQGVNGDAAIYSVDGNNSYGHPAQEVCDLLSAKFKKSKRTDKIASAIEEPI